MNVRKLVAAILIVLGTIALVYRGFTVPTDRHSAKVGPLEFSVVEKERFEVPTWAGVAAILVGAGLLVVRRR
ncbi:MAG: hypothetical protein H6511_03785 [Holophagales bacterium]|nr:hypothetical protein [Holophagales bacterium]